MSISYIKVSRTSYANADELSQVNLAFGIISDGNFNIRVLKGSLNNFSKSTKLLTPVISSIEYSTGVRDAFQGKVPKLGYWASSLTWKLSKDELWSSLFVSFSILEPERLLPGGIASASVVCCGCWKVSVDQGVPALLLLDGKRSGNTMRLEISLKLPGSTVLLLKESKQSSTDSRLLGYDKLSQRHHSYCYILSPHPSNSAPPQSRRLPSLSNP